ncbi:hypothetical protein Lser_V15G42978 [Lactuca serriola]
MEIAWYGIEQEYTLLQKDTLWSLAGPKEASQDLRPILLWVGVDKAFGRDIIDAHFKACLYVGINIGGINHEVMPDQWEFHLFSSVGEEI